MVLVFADEFEDASRNFRPGRDSKWQALNLHYDVNGDLANFRDSAVSLQGGAAIITVTRENVTAPASGRWGEKQVAMPYKSGMLQGWNKFCFTGGMVEARVKLPGGVDYGGLWPAIFTMGNLGRAGYVRSTEGIWPYMYDVCDAAAVSRVPWSSQNGQLINRCNSTKGRGSPEIDLFEVGVWQAGQPLLSTSMQAAPLLPPETHWLDVPGGTYLPTAGDPRLRSRPNDWPGVNSYAGHPRPGSEVQDSISAVHNLNASFFEAFHTYAFDWLPGPAGYIRWYLDGQLIYEINSAALKGQANSRNQSVGDRNIPAEPSYININVAMADTFVKVDPKLPLPARMEVDYVRVYQPRDAINVGCSPPDFPTRDYIACNVDKYKLTTWDDYVQAGQCSQQGGPSKLMLAILIPCVVGGPLAVLIALWCACRRHLLGGPWTSAKVAASPSLVQVATAQPVPLHQQQRHGRLPPLRVPPPELPPPQQHGRLPPLRVQPPGPGLQQQGAGLAFPGLDRDVDSVVQVVAMGRQQGMAEGRKGSSIPGVA